MTAVELRTVWEQAQQAMFRFADRGENSELRPRAAIQVHTPPRLQGRVNAAWTMLILTPQTASITAGAVLISFVDYRLLLVVISVIIGACALLLLIRPAPEPVATADGLPDEALDPAA